MLLLVGACWVLLFQMFHVSIHVRKFGDRGTEGLAWKTQVGNAPLRAAKGVSAAFVRFCAEFADRVGEAPILLFVSFFSLCYKRPSLLRRDTA